MVLRVSTPRFPWFIHVQPAPHLAVFLLATLNVTFPKPAAPSSPVLFCYLRGNTPSTIHRRRGPSVPAPRSRIIPTQFFHHAGLPWILMQLPAAPSQSPPEAKTSPFHDLPPRLPPCSRPSRSAMLCRQYLRATHR